MGRKRREPVEFKAEETKPDPKQVTGGDEPNESPIRTFTPEADSGELPPRLEVQATPPSGPSEPSEGPDGGSDVQGSESGSESRVEASTVGSVGEGNNEPLSPEQSRANDEVLAVKGDTAPTQPNPAPSEVFANQFDEASEAQDGEIPEFRAPQRYKVQRAMVGVYNPGAIVDMDALGLEDERIKMFVAAGYLLPV